MHAVRERDAAIGSCTVGQVTPLALTQASALSVDSLKTTRMKTRSLAAGLWIVPVRMSHGSKRNESISATVGAAIPTTTCSAAARH